MMDFIGMRKKIPVMRVDILTSISIVRKAMILINIKAKMRVNLEEYKIEDSDTMNQFEGMITCLKMKK